MMQESDNRQDVGEYHGDPSALVCGNRWSLDEEGILCSNGRLLLRDLAKFPKLKSVHLSSAIVDAEGVTPLLKVISLVISDREVDSQAIGNAFPNLETLVIVETDFDFERLPPLAKLRLIVVARGSPPSASGLSRQPALESVDFVYLACKGCEQDLEGALRQLRPDIKIRAFSSEVRAPNGVGL
ncbi:MAG: hypothetical protein R3B06_08320 [Kofleriaceae bacterium]